MKPLEIETLHYRRIYGYFKDTVADIILGEVAGDYDGRIRQNLLSEGAEILPGEAPRLLPLVKRALKAAGTDFPVELLLNREAGNLARAVPSSRSESENYIILSPDSLCLSNAALGFIIGHEVGHIAFRHQVLKWIVGTVYTEDSTMPPFIHNEYSIWSRCAELSADRVGLAATGSHSAAEEAFGMMEDSSESNREERLHCLVEPETVNDIHKKMTASPESGFSSQLVRLLVAAGDILARSDGRRHRSEKAYMLNRISRHGYIGDLNRRPDMAECERETADAAGIIRADYPERMKEAFLNLAIIIVRDGKVARKEYQELQRIGRDYLGIDDDSMNSLILRVFRSGFFDPAGE